MRLPPAKHGRLYALGLLAMALAMVYAIGLHWWWTAPMLAMDSHIEELRQQELQARMTIVQQRPADRKAPG